MSQKVLSHEEFSDTLENAKVFILRLNWSKDTNVAQSNIVGTYFVIIFELKLFLSATINLLSLYILFVLLIHCAIHFSPKSASQLEID